MTTFLRPSPPVPWGDPWPAVSVGIVTLELLALGGT